MSIVSLANYTPAPRFDGVIWNRAIIQEAPQVSGPWTALVVVTLTPPDTDPESPQSRSFTVQGTLDAGWYRVIFEDAAGQTLAPTNPVQNVNNYTPSVMQVASLLRARTVDTAGVEIGTFNDATRPTEDQVLELIANAVGTLATKIGDTIPDVLIDEAKRLAAIRAAMLVELSYWPQMIRTNNSAYSQFESLWKEGFGDGKIPGTLVTAVTAAIQNNGENKPTEPGLPMFGFPVSQRVGSRRL